MYSRKPTLSGTRYLILLFILVLAACDTFGGQQGAIPASTATPSPGLPLKGFQELTATGPTTPTTPTVIICHAPPATATSFQGWQLYTDPHYPFHFLYPPGWKAGPVSFSDGDGSDVYYAVILLPPTGHTPITSQSEITEPEHIELTLVLKGTADSFSQDTSWTPDTTPVSLSHRPTKLYYEFSPGCDELDHATDPVTFGKYPYFFVGVSRQQADKVKDFQYFLGVVRSFTYTGS